MISISLCSKNCLHTLATWSWHCGLPREALHYFRVLRVGSRISSQYLMAVRIPFLACSGLCIPPWIYLPRPPPNSHLVQCHREHVLHGIFRPFQSRSGRTCSYLLNIHGTSGGPVSSGVLWKSQLVWQQALPGSERWVCWRRPSGESLFHEVYFWLFG